MHIRATRASSDHEIDLIASRMRLTLMEVLGKEAGASRYTLDWLRARVRFHLDAQRCVGAVYVAESPTGKIVGQSIVRIEPARATAAPAARDEYGLMATIYVEPEARREGVAGRLVDQVEAWMRAQGLARAATNTSQHNDKLIRLFEKRGYQISLRTDDMVQLTRAL